MKYLYTPMKTINLLFFFLCFSPVLLDASSNTAQAASTNACSSSSASASTAAAASAAVAASSSSAKAASDKAVEKESANQKNEKLSLIEVPYRQRSLKFQDSGKVKVTFKTAILPGTRGPACSFTTDVMYDPVDDGEIDLDYTKQQIKLCLWKALQDKMKKTQLECTEYHWTTPRVLEFNRGIKSPQKVKCKHTADPKFKLCQLELTIT